jgi:methylated-DNA-[protein]-cysteine S-methyltransferase
MGRKYAIFDSGVGRCGIVWSDAGIVSVQLPEAREIETRRRLYRLYPEAREHRPPAMVEARSGASPRSCAGATAIFPR